MKHIYLTFEDEEMVFLKQKKVYELGGNLFLMQLEMKMLSQNKHNTWYRNAYRTNLNGFRDKQLKKSIIRSKISTQRSHFLLSLPVEELLKEVGYYERENNTSYM